MTRPRHQRASRSFGPAAALVISLALTSLAFAAHTTSYRGHGDGHEPAKGFPISFVISGGVVKHIRVTADVTCHVTPSVDGGPSLETHTEQVTIPGSARLNGPSFYLA